MQLSVIQKKIFDIRGQKVMLDFDLAEMYGVETKVFNQAVKRNTARFPTDFIFTLTRREFQDLRSQFVTSSWGGKRYMPKVFTEQGVAMLSSVLNSEKAIEMNIAIVRAFVLIRQSAIDFKELNEKLKKLEKKYNKNFSDVYKALNYLIEKKKVEDQPKKTRIGFKPDE